MTVYMTIGLPGSGKSTWASRTGLPVISPDLLRKDFGFAPDDITVFRKIYEQAVEFSSRGIDFVYDATNLKRSYRMELLEKLGNVHKIAVLFPVSIKTSFERNRIRKAAVPENVIIKMAGGFDVPFCLEGFDETVVMPNKESLCYENFRVPQDFRYYSFCQEIRRLLQEKPKKIRSGLLQGTVKIDMYKTYLDRDLSTLIHSNTVNDIINSVYGRSHDLEAEKIIKRIFGSKFSVAAFLESQLQNDELMDLMFVSNHDGGIIFPVAANQDIVPYHGYIGEQTSIYHKENIYDHLLLVTGGLLEARADDKMLLTGLLHDASKKYETGTNRRGELCFINHEKSSAYIAAYIFKILGFTEEETYPYIDIIFNHLLPFKWEPEDVDVFCKEHGDFVTDKMLLLNHYDIGALKSEDLQGELAQRLENGRKAAARLEALYG